MTGPTRLSGDLTLTIVGLGLMGGSLALALRRLENRPRLVGVVRSPERAAEVAQRDVVDEVTADLVAGVSQADVVVLATPVRTLIRHLRIIGPHLKPAAVVLDLGSTKAAVCEAMAALPDHVQPVGGHPMCGKEVSGLEHADARLYEGATFVLSPLPRTASWAVELCSDLVRSVGARPLVLDPERHDFLVAAISHLPYLAAVALMAAAHRVGEADPTVWRLAASGFRDTSRLASSDVTMMLDILMTNRQAVLAVLERYMEELGTLYRLIEEGVEGPLILYLNGMKALRDAHFARRETG